MTYSKRRNRNIRLRQEMKQDRRKRFSASNTARWWSINPATTNRRNRF